MDFQKNEVHINLDQFWPVEHPTEPLEEDQPVKYPIPHTSALKDNEAKVEQCFFSESLRRKAKLLEVIDEKEMMVGRERPRRAVRRRHHMNNKRENTATSSNVSSLSFSTFERYNLP